MDDRGLLSLLEQEAAQAIGTATGATVAHRLAALKAYRGDADSGRLKIVDGRSQVVDTVFRDTVEWLLPDLLRIFVSGAQVVKFAPFGQEDEEGAEQETDAVNHIVMQENQGFLIFHTWIKDGLMFRNGWVKYWWDERGDWIRESYYGIPDISVRLFELNDTVEIVSTKASTKAGAKLDQTTALSAPTFDVVIRRQVNGPGVRIEAVPPEEILIARDAKNVQTARYIEHRRLVRVSDLIADGLDRETAEELPAANNPEWQSERSERLRGKDIDFALGGPAEAATKEVLIGEAWVRIDWDDDGVAELRRIKYAVGSKILENEEADFATLETWSPVLQQHTIEGFGYYDLTAEPQDVGSTILRQAFDNIYQSGDGIWDLPLGAQTSDTIADLLASGPRVVRTKEPNALRQLFPPVTYPHSFAAMEQITEWTSRRTGSTPYTQGMDAESLNKTATGISLIQRAGNARKELIARVFAETAVKPLMLGIHRLLRQHSDAAKKKALRMRGKWVEVDPSQWKHRMDMTVEVGLAEDNAAKFARLSQLGQWYAQVLQLQGGKPVGPWLYPQGISNFLDDLTRAAGERLTERYIADPMAPPPPLPPQLTQQQGPPPELMLKAQEMKATDARERLNMMLTHARETQKIRIGAGQTEREMDLKQAALDIEAIETGFRMARERSATQEAEE